MDMDGYGWSWMVMDGYGGFWMISGGYECLWMVTMEMMEMVVCEGMVGYDKHNCNSWTRWM